MDMNGQVYHSIFFKIITGLFFALVSGTASSEVTTEKADSISIKALGERSFSSSLQLEKELTRTKNYSTALMNYDSDGLKLFTLVNIPTSRMPEKGFPVLIFGHGLHPEPKKYGTNTETGEDSRPGDYYRGLPESYAEQGFVVLNPDYRGHNKSEGFEYTQTKFLATSYYAVDVLHLIAALPSLDNVDLDRIYYMGHSMGGDVGLKMLLSSDKIRAASLWAPVVATTYEQVLYYNSDEADPFVDSKNMKQYTQKIATTYQSLPFSLSYEQVDPINFISDLSVPVIIHHARGDVSVPYMWSERLVAELFRYAKVFKFFQYNSDNHLFKSNNRELAVARDIAFFKAH